MDSVKRYLEKKIEGSEAKIAGKMSAMEGKIADKIESNANIAKTIETIEVKMRAMEEKMEGRMDQILELLQGPSQRAGAGHPT
jgi:hypothetical protein